MKIPLLLTLGAALLAVAQPTIPPADTAQTTPHRRLALVCEIGRSKVPALDATLSEYTLADHYTNSHFTNFLDAAVGFEYPLHPRISLVPTVGVSFGTLSSGRAGGDLVIIQPPRGRVLLFLKADCRYYALINATRVVYLTGTLGMADPSGFTLPEYRLRLHAVGPVTGWGAAFQFRTRSDRRFGLEGGQLSYPVSISYHADIYDYVGPYWERTYIRTDYVQRIRDFRTTYFKLTFSI